MIGHPGFRVEPWCLRECGLDLGVIAQSESLFALANGHIGIRGNLDEGEPHGIPGTYLNSVYERRPLPYAEVGYGFAEAGETVINVTNGKIIRLLVDDEPFDVRYGTLDYHERTLDFRAGTLTREIRWTSPAGCSVVIRSTRLVSFTHRAIVAIQYHVEAVDPVRVVVQSELVANESLPDLGHDPRTAAQLEFPLVVEDNVAHRQGAVMVHRTKTSGLRLGAAMDHEVAGPDGTGIDVDASGDVARVTVASGLERGGSLDVLKLVAYGWSASRSRPAVQDQVVAALSSARNTGWDGLVSEQRKFLSTTIGRERTWRCSGTPKCSKRPRFGMFHVLQAGARAEARPIAAKGLTGPGYDGHTFWDAET